MDASNDVSEDDGNLLPLMPMSKSGLRVARDSARSDIWLSSSVFRHTHVSGIPHALTRFLMEAVAASLACGKIVGMLDSHFTTEHKFPPSQGKFDGIFLFCVNQGRGLLSVRVRRPKYARKMCSGIQPLSSSPQPTGTPLKDYIILRINQHEALAALRPCLVGSYPKVMISV